MGAQTLGAAGTVMTGKKISHYKILDKLGEGGMGVVYKAEDARLHRTVALKFLPRQGGEPDDRERFFREARAAASLDHANICTVYEIDEVDGQAFLAMAFLEGRTLDARIEQGPLPLGEALEIARQTAEGLEVAHAKGVVHRDIKPANLMLIGDNPSKPQVKILDFGLAQLSEVSKLTQKNSLLGTIAYMSPEQTQGQTVDRRADIWALGAVLYEMIAGSTPFKGHYEQATMYSILNEEPEPLTAVRSRVPIEVEWVVDKCLAKDPDQRFQSAAELAVDLQTLARKLDSQKLSIHRSQVQPLSPDRTVAAPPTRIVPKPTAEAGRPASTQKRALAALVLAAAFVGGLVAYRGFSSGAEEVVTPSTPRRFEILVGQGLPRGVSLRDAAIAPDGSSIAYTLTQPEAALRMRDLSALESRTLEGSEGVRQFAWSPDGLWMAYVVDREVRKIPASGGRSIVLCEAPGQFVGGVAWSAEGESVIFVAGPPLALLEVSANGGRPAPVGGVESGEKGRGRMLISGLQIIEDPSGERSLLYAARSRGGDQVLIRSLDRERRATLVEGSEPFYASSGHLLYRAARSGVELWAARLDLATLEIVGAPFPVAYGSSHPTVSADGTLVSVADSLSGPRRLVWRDRSGAEAGTIGREQARISDPAVSPDGLRVAVAGAEGERGDVWIHDARRGIKTRLTVDEDGDFRPIWSPDGKQLLYHSTSADGALWLRDADGGGSPQAILPASRGLRLVDWSPDGESILIRLRGSGGSGLHSLQRQPDGSFDQQPYLEAESLVDDARFSPDGKWVAYELNESGQFEVFVKPFPSAPGRWQVSTEGGRTPRWGPAGDELFYVQGDALTVVPIRADVGGEVQIGEPQELFNHPSLSGPFRAPGYDVAPDGERFVLIEPAGDPPPSSLRVTLDWAAEFDR